MGKIFLIITGLSLVFFIACGPSAEEQEKQKKTADSAFEKERNIALENANNLLSDSASTEDSVAKAEPQKK